MPSYKATWFFVDSTNVTGWTENFYVNAASNDAAAVAVSNYQSVRVALLSDLGKLTNLRISATGKPRDSKFYTLGSQQTGLIAHATRPIAGVWDTLLIRLDNAAGTMFGHMFLRLVPGDIFTGRTYTPGVPPPANWQNQMTAFATELTTGTYLRKVKVGGVAGYAPISQMIGMARTERKLGRPFDSLHGRRKTPV
jgi:hypothetical protein